MPLARDLFAADPVEPSQELMPRFTVRSHGGDYDVQFLVSLDELALGIPAGDICLTLADRNLVRLYPELFAALRRPLLELDALEDNKTLDGVLQVLNFLQEHNADRQAILVVIGGGIMQDIGTVAAHLYYRGIRWVYVPTTLLGMSDSCIGAKCGLNLNAFKNQLGVFHAPHQVLVCPSLLSTLQEADRRSGFGEVIKLHLTGSRKLWDRLRRSVEPSGLDSPDLPLLILDSLRVKQRVIEADEYEQDLRRILNYGHTFGHALEAITAHAVPHGSAVAWGMDLVNYLSWQAGRLAQSDFTQIHQFLESWYRGSLPQPITTAQLIAAARRDKKVEAGKVNLALLHEPGDLRIVPTAFDQALETGIEGYLRDHSFLT